MADNPFSTETALKRYMSGKSYLSGLSLANEIVCELHGPRLEKLKQGLSELAKCRTSAEVLAQSSADLLIQINFIEYKSVPRGKQGQGRDSGGPPLSSAIKDLRRNFRNIKTEKELEKAMQTAKRMKGPIISVRALRETRESIANHPDLLARKGHDEYYSGPHIAKAAREALGGRITLDPASCEAANRMIGAERIYTKEDNGLQYSWAEELVFLNPPYMKIGPTGQLPPFILKAIEEPKAAVVLTNARTDRVTWSQPLLKAANAVCFIAKPMKFWDKGGEENKTRPMVGQMVTSLRCDVAAFKRAFEGFGVTRGLC